VERADLSEQPVDIKAPVLLISSNGVCAHDAVTYY
jgi:hypothetical protein